MLFKKKVEAEVFGELVIEPFSRHCNTALNKMSDLCDTYTDAETRTFFGLWLLSLGELFRHVLNTEVSTRAAGSYYRATSGILENASFKGNPEEARTDVSHLAKSQEASISRGNWSDYSEAVLDFIVGSAFSENKLALRNRNEIVTRILIDHGAASREMLDLSNRYKIV